jgi:hypothetical protein
MVAYIDDFKLSCCWRSAPYLAAADARSARPAGTAVTVASAPAND